MKRIVIYILVFYLVFPAFLLSHPVNSKKTDKNADTQSDFNIYPHILIGINLVLAGLTTAAAIQQYNLSNDYEKLYSSINNTTQENYYRLLYEQEKVNSAGDFVLISGIATGLIISFTLLDYFILHKFFSETKWTAQIDLNNKETYSMIRFEY